MNTKQLKQKILDLAIRGKLVPQDPNDEPASVLLERIRQEKEELIKQGKFKRTKITTDKPHYENIPQGWAVAQLQNCGIDLLNGFAFQSKQYVSKGIKVIRITNVQDGYIVDNDPKYYPIEMLQELDKYILCEGDLLMSLTGNVGRVGLLPKNMLPAALNQRVACLRFNDVAINKLYLFYYLQSEKFKKNCIDSGKGVAQLNISTEWLKQYKLFVPPLKEQERIVAEIEKWFALIDDLEANKADLQATISQTKSKILSLAISGKLVEQDPNDEPAIELLKRINPHFTPCDTSHYENIPNSWEVATLKDVAKTISTRQYQILQSEIKEVASYPVVSQSANYIEGYSEQVDKLYHSTCPVVIFGDHTRAVKYIDFDFIVGADGVKIILPMIDSKYCYYLMMYGSEKIKDRGYGRHWGYLSKFPIPIPPLTEQRWIVAALEHIFNSLDTISADL